MSINKSNLTSEVFKLFLNRMKSDVTTVSIADKGVENSKSVIIQGYRTSFNDKDFEQKSNLPILIVDTPTMSIDTFTLQRDEVSGKVMIEIFTTQAESADKFIEQIVDSIERYRTTLAEEGLHSVKLDSTEADQAMRGEMSVHIRRASFTWMFRYTRTRAW